MMRLGRGCGLAGAVLCVLASAVAAPPLSAQDGSAAYALFQQGNHEQAIQTAQTELLDNPNSIDARIVLGWSSLAIGRYQSALDIALDTQRLAPEDGRLAAIIGEAHYALGNYLDALPFLERYVALLPTGIAVARVHSIMAEIFIQFGEYHHARAAFAAALHFDPTVFSWWERAGFVYEQLQQYGLAAEAYRRAVALNPNDIQVQQALDRVSP